MYLGSYLRGDSRNESRKDCRRCILEGELIVI